LAIFKDSYRSRKITSGARKPPMVTAQACKTDHVGVPGVDDLTVATVWGLSISDFGLIRKKTF